MTALRICIHAGCPLMNVNTHAIRSRAIGGKNIGFEREALGVTFDLAAVDCHTHVAGNIRFINTYGRAECIIFDGK